MRVLASPIIAQGNPYIGLLYSALAERGVVVEQFSLNTIKQPCDICHVHWPDLILSEKSIFASFNQVFRFFAMLVWCKLRWRSKVLWTVHNLEPHDRTLPNWWRRLFYRIWIGLVDGCIFMSEASRHEFEFKYQRSFSHSIIPHGHYCDLYEKIVPEKGLKERLGIEPLDVVFGHYGQIRDYKNVPHLMREFSKLTSDRYKLIIAGKVHSKDGRLLREIESLAAADDRIHFIPGFVSDPMIKGLYKLTHWAVLPYKDILNSGSAILALSLSCPVLVPNFPTMLELRSQIGTDLIRLISETGLSRALHECSSHSSKGCEREHLKELEWPALSSCTHDFYTKILRKK